MIEIKQPSVAGTFYPSNSDELNTMINGLLDEVHLNHIRKPIGCIVPHAGYVYSGIVAAHAYKVIQSFNYESVVILAPSHFDGFDGLSIYPGDGMKTPLGIVKIDDEKRSYAVERGYAVHSIDGFRQEHSLEVQLPFLQSVQSDIKIVPIVMGYQERKTIEVAATLLSEYIRQNCLIIISSDLSHYHSYEKAIEMDTKCCSLISTMDINGLWKSQSSKDVEACGFGPIQAFLSCCPSDHNVRFDLLDYRNSGDTAGGKDQVVGYCSFACVKND